MAKSTMRAARPGATKQKPGTTTKPAAKAKPAAKGKPTAKAKPAASRPGALPALVIADLSQAARAAFAKAIGECKTVDAIAKRAKALAEVLDTPGCKRLVELIEAQAKALAPLGYIQHITSKPRRVTLAKRLSQLEVLACAARLVGTAQDAKLVAVVKALPDSAVRVTLVTVLCGGQISLRPGARRELAALLDDPGTSDGVILRSAVHALFALDVAAASKRARALLAGAGKAKRPRELAVIHALLDGIEGYAAEHAAFALAAWPEVFPLTTHADETIAGKARHLITRERGVFLAYLAWAIADHDTPAVHEVIAKELYWAMLPGKHLDAAAVGPPLQALLARATKRKATAGVEAITLALKGLGVIPREPAPAHGSLIANVGTEGGPPLLVPAKHLAAWQGTLGPEPFDSGNSDYERACDAPHPSLIAIGKGHGLVLDAQGVEVFAEPTGLFLLAHGDPAEEVAKAWKTLGTLVVPAGGIVVLDAAEAGSAKGINRRALKLTAGSYEVRAHAPKGLGADLSAVRLVRA